MILKCTRSIVASLVVFALVALSGAGCNRAAIRIPGASTNFPSTSTQYKGKTAYPYTIVVANPIDQRSKHFGEQVAGTKWTGCSTDALWVEDATQLIQQRLVTELAASDLFAKVTTSPTSPQDIVMRTDVDAFCSQMVGVIFGRVVGISALQVTLEQKDKVLLKQKFEKVVTDADKEYTGSSIGFIEQAMVRTMSDSLRELMKDMLKRFEADAPGWVSGSAKQPAPQPASVPGS
jgi:hypothetical protein